MATNKDPVEKLFVVYNQTRIDKGVIPIIPAEYEMGPPMAYFGPRSIENTRCILTPRSNRAALGLVYVYYSRKDLSTILPTPLSITKGSATRVHQLVDKLNAALSIESTTGDWVDGPLVDSQITLYASLDNRVFIGSMPVNLV